MQILPTPTPSATAPPAPAPAPAPLPTRLSCLLDDGALLQQVTRLYEALLQDECRHRLEPCARCPRPDMAIRHRRLRALYDDCKLVLALIDGPLHDHAESQPET